MDGTDSATMETGMVRRKADAPGEPEFVSTDAS
jgi:hypothetical protein